MPGPYTSFTSGSQVSSPAQFGRLDVHMGAVVAVVAPARFVAAGAAAPLWGSWTFPDGVVGIAYSQSWDMPASAEVVTYSVLSGALPDGLALTTAAHNLAEISGTPTVAGVFAFTLRAVNSAGTADKAFSITITAAPSANYGYTS